MNIGTRKKIWITGFLLAALLLLICWPLADWLQLSERHAPPDGQYDAVYLVCGARAQGRRIAALANWLDERRKLSDQSDAENIPILVGRDPQKSYWCRRHQTNHTVTAWAIERLGNTLPPKPPPVIKIVPGNFSTTDGEMRALAVYLRRHPEICSIALVTSRYHARRAYQRLRAHAANRVKIHIVPGITRWQNRSPIKVVLECLKIARDHAGLSSAPLISRAPARQ